jgi:hypothetical protein
MSIQSSSSIHSIHYPPPISVKPVSRITQATLEGLRNEKVTQATQEHLKRYQALRNLNPLSLSSQEPTVKLRKEQLADYELHFDKTGAISSKKFDFSGKENYLFVMANNKVYAGIYSQGSFDHSSFDTSTPYPTKGGIVVENGKILEVAIHGLSYSQFFDHLGNKGVRLSELRLTRVSSTAIRSCYNAAEYFYLDPCPQVFRTWTSVAKKLRTKEPTLRCWWPTDRAGGIERRAQLSYEVDRREPSVLLTEKKDTTHWVVYSRKELLEGLSKLKNKNVDLRNIKLTLIDRKYVYVGEYPDWQDIFKIYNVHEYLQSKENCPYMASSHNHALSLFTHARFGARATWATDKPVTQSSYKTAFLQKLPYRSPNKQNPILLSTVNTIDKFTLVFEEYKEAAMSAVEYRPVPFALWPSDNQGTFEMVVRNPITGMAFEHQGRIEKDQCVYTTIDLLLKETFGLEEYFSPWETIDEVKDKEKEKSKILKDSEDNLWNHLDELKEME